MLEIIIVADVNDGDLIESVNEISQEDLERFRPLIEAVKKFKKYEVVVGNLSLIHNHNWPQGENLMENLGEKSPIELYSEFDEDLIVEFEEDWLPFAEYGIHTIKSITVAPIVEKEILL